MSKGTNHAAYRHHLAFVHTPPFAQFADGLAVYNGHGTCRIVPREEVEEGAFDIEVLKTGAREASFRILARRDHDNCVRSLTSAGITAAEHAFLRRMGCAFGGILSKKLLPEHPDYGVEPAASGKGRIFQRPASYFFASEIAKEKSSGVPSGLLALADLKAARPLFTQNGVTTGFSNVRSIEQARNLLMYENLSPEIVYEDLDKDGVSIGVFYYFNIGKENIATLNRIDGTLSIFRRPDPFLDRHLAQGRARILERIPADKLAIYDIDVAEPLSPEFYPAGIPDETSATTLTASSSPRP